MNLKKTMLSSLVAGVLLSCSYFAFAAPSNQDGYVLQIMNHTEDDPAGQPGDYSWRCLDNDKQPVKTTGAYTLKISVNGAQPQELKADGNWLTIDDFPSGDVNLAKDVLKGKNKCGDTLKTKYNAKSGVMTHIYPNTYLSFQPIKGSTSAILNILNCDGGLAAKCKVLPPK